MIELHKYERVHVYHTRSKCTHIYGPNQSGGHVGGGVLTTLRNNLAPPRRGGRAFIRGGHIFEQVRYNNCIYNRYAREVPLYADDDKRGILVHQTVPLTIIGASLSEPNISDLSTVW